MENDGFAYYAGGQYYNPVMGRMLSLRGPFSSAGGRGSRVAPVAAAMAAVSADAGGGVWAGPFWSVPGSAAPAYCGSVGAGTGYFLGSLFGGIEGGSSFGPAGR